MTCLSDGTYICDGWACRKTTKQPTRWFKVISAPLRYGKQAPVPDADYHYCYACGMDLHFRLLNVGIPHEFNCIRAEQDPAQWGRIFIP